MADDLEERLNSHAQAFEGLMSLIPAKQYYAQDTSDQWQKKKQTKAQKKEAKRAKLDPENHISAKDVMDENERKRKRQLDGEDDDSSDFDAEGKEKPREGLKASLKEAKKQKTEAPEEEEDEATKAGRLERQKQIAERRAAKKAKQLELAEAKRAKLAESASVNGITEDKQKTSQQKPAKEPKKKAEQKPKPSAVEDDASDAGSDAEANNDDEIDQVDVSGLVDDEQQDGTSASPSPEPESSNSSAAPTASSASSTVPSQLPLDSPAKPNKIKLPEVDQEVLQSRLKARIEALRAARKADGIDGKPARNRQELLDARRKKEEQRRQHKKELRKQAKDDEQRLAAEAELARLRGSGSPGTPDIFSPREESSNNFSFGRITFGDGVEAAADASALLDPRKKKGRSDPKTALEAAERKRQRLAGLDEGKRADIAEKDAWLNAKRRAHGEKVRDDANLLKKTLKRKEKAKLKSEKEWNERKEGVAKGQAMKQKRREENLRKRKEEKGSKPGKKKGGASSGGKKKRPGFEGTLRSR
ncbi:SURF6-domain-containing protein [Saccharata proteae CBS 121410]|uniref:SURF6-domain-containing protein n=1 Tax=Saccharata proteae CBS 121410 TaxID=1314787 RepID=A0A9P4LWK6_9PEZI|nr:SURF6-domain-containing protein [Saccharata proteae CBS 121410]